MLEASSDAIALGAPANEEALSNGFSFTVPADPGVNDGAVTCAASEAKAAAEVARA